MKSPPPKLIDRITVRKLTSLPESMLQLLQACNDPDSEFDDIAKIVEQDSGLTAKMLHVANSPMYAQWGKIDNLGRMLIILGFNTIKTIAVTSGILDFFSGIEGGQKSLQQALWYRSLLSAQLAAGLCQATGNDCKDEAYLAGLLHKTGQLVLISSDPLAYQQLLQTAAGPQNLAAAETGQFGISQTELGAWLVHKWRLDDFVSDAVLFHLEPARGLLDAPSLVKIVNLAAGLADPDRRDTAVQDAPRLIGLASSEVQKILEASEDSIKQMSEALGVDASGDYDLALGTGQADVSPSNSTELAAEVRSAALLDSIKATLWSDNSLKHPGPAIQTFFTVLFGPDTHLLFQLNNNGQLSGVPCGEQDAWLKEMKVTLEPGRSLISDALLRHSQLDSFRHSVTNQTLSVFDRQLIRRCGRTGLLAVPLLAGKKPVGVLAVGVDPSTLDELAPQSKLLERFAEEVAVLLAHHRSTQDNLELRLREAQAEFVQDIRKARHEINNPLGIVSNYLHILGGKLGEEHPAQEELGVVRSEIERVGNLLLGMTDRLTPEASPTDQVDLNTLVAALLNVLRPSLFDLNSIDLRADLDTTLKPFTGKPDSLKQIVINLLKNAAEATPKGGWVEIRTRANVLTERGRSVEIGVRDNGPGLPESVQQRLFLPVNSTKGRDHSGLGLSIVGQLVKEMQGSIQCRTNDEGTQFLIHVPTQKQ
jgi:signal transduction histidine kinase/HD-like signal output (HDOD) protein